MIIYPPEFHTHAISGTSLSPCLRALVKRAADMDEARVATTLKDAARLAAKMEPTRAEEFMGAAAFARGYMLGEELEIDGEASA